LWPSVLDHLRLRRARGEPARAYNVLQKLAYLGIMFWLLPCMVLTGLAMSPWIDSLWPGWVDWLGGRQSARTLHFVGAWVIAAFVLVHLFEVIVTGPLNNLRSIVTGRFRIEPSPGGGANGRGRR
jgi:thiosulfate reductase cytochrome b subunit